MTRQPRILGAALAALATLAVGGVAWAQEAPTTPSTEPPAAAAPATGDEPTRPKDCPDRGEGGTRAATVDEISL